MNFKEKREFLNKYHKSEATSNGGFVSDLFPIGEVQVGEEVGIRFVPDEDVNMFCWRLARYRDIPFERYQQPNGQVVAVSKPFKVRVPAFNLKGSNTSLGDLASEYLFKSSDDPIQTSLNGQYGDDDASRAFYRKYKATSSYISYGFVVDSNSHPEWIGKFFRFSFGEQIQGKIEGFYNDTDRDCDFFDLDNGCTFRLRKSKKGEFNTYEDSNFSPKTSPLPDNLKAILAEKINSGEKKALKSFLLKHPSNEELVLMLKMYTASANTGPFLAEWAKTFKPFGFKLDEAGNMISTSSDNSVTQVDTTASRVASVVEQVQAQVQQPVVNVAPTPVPTPVLEPTPVVAPTPVKEETPVEVKVAAPAIDLTAMLKPMQEAVQPAQKASTPNMGLDLASVLSQLKK